MIRKCCPDFEMLEVSIRKIKDIIARKGRLRFPRLKSLKLADESYADIVQFSNDLFESLIGTSHLEELKLDHLRSNELYMEPTIKEHMQRGSLVALKKCSIRYHEEDFEVLIQHCPNITHLTGWWIDPVRWDERREKYARNLLKIFSTYGPQLKSFRFNGMVTGSTMEAINAILKECKNLESLVLDFTPPSYGMLQYENKAVESAIPLFGYLDKLTEIKLVRSRDFKIKPETICELIKRCGINLKSFTLEYRGYESQKILNAIGANARNLETLKLDNIEHINEDWEQGITEDEIRQIQESVDAILEGCQKLETLHFQMRDSRGKVELNFPIYDQIAKKENLHLKYLRLEGILGYPQPSLLKLIQALPNCNIDWMHDIMIFR